MFPRLLIIGPEDTECEIGFESMETRWLNACHCRIVYERAIMSVRMVYYLSSLPLPYIMYQPLDNPQKKEE